MHENWTTFPLWPIIEGRCGCGDVSCSNIGKHPAVTWSKVKKGESVLHEKNYGICTGARSGVIVVDCDVKEGVDGVANLEALGPVPETYVVATPSGGFHFYFLAPDFAVPNSVSALTPGVDIRGDGGYVVGPGSSHRNGGTYKGLGGQVAEAPAWLLGWLRQQALARIQTDSTTLSVRSIDPEHPEWESRHQRAYEYLAKAPPCISGQGGHALLWDVAVMLVRKLELPQETAADLICEHFNPRCLPPWSPQEIEHKLRDAANKGRTPPGVAPADWDMQVTPGHELKISAVVDEEKKGRRKKDPAHVYIFEPGVHTSAERQKGKATLELVTRTLNDHPDWAGVWQYDVFKQQILAVNPPMRLDAETVGLTDADITGVQLWLESMDFTTYRDNIKYAIESASRRNQFHPVLEYLESLPKVDPSILDHAATALWSGDQLDCELFKRILIAACKRIIDPGTKVDTIFVLFGPGGYFKSTFCRKLFHPWFRDQMPDLSNRDASHALQGFWGIEMAELDNLQRLESSTIKDFLSRQTDQYRQFGNGNKIEAPRQCVFFGTTNEDKFLRDATGNRRYWPVIIEQKIDLSFDRDKLWSAAYQLARAGEPHYLSYDTEQLLLKGRLEQFVVHDAWHEKIESFISGKEWVSSDQVYSAMGVMDANKDARGLRRVVDSLKRLGCKRVTKRRHDGGFEKRWKVSAEYSEVAKKGNQQSSN